LISFTNDEGIQRLDITTVTGQDRHFTVDPVQYGIAEMADDTDLDGNVKFDDFLRLEAAFGGVAVTLTSTA